MKNKIIAGAVILGGIVGATLLMSDDRDSGSNGSPSRDNDYSTERSYDDYGDKDCGDFSSQSEAQRFFEAEGGPSSDYHGLDRDSDGIACESI